MPKAFFYKNCNTKPFSANLETHISNEKCVCYHEKRLKVKEKI